MHINLSLKKKPANGVRKEKIKCLKGLKKEEEEEQ